MYVEIDLVIGLCISALLCGFFLGCAFMKHYFKDILKKHQMMFGKIDSEFFKIL